MIDPTPAENALIRLRNAAREMEDRVLAAKSAATKVKYSLALAIERMGNANTPEKVPTTLRKELAWADVEVQEDEQEKNKAEAYLIGLNAKCDVDKITISLYQTMVKDRT